MKPTVAIIAACMALVSAVEPVAKRVSQVAENATECQGSVDGHFKLTVVDGKKDKRAVPQPETKADCNTDGSLTVTLKDGILKDKEGRTAYISSNFQLQFDDPPQSGAISAGGFAVCHDGYLSLNQGNTEFFECKSGEFWNIYDRNWAEHCDAVYLLSNPCTADGESLDGGSTETVAGAGAKTITVPTKVITVMGDGQPQIRTTDVGKVVCQIDDGQVQGHTTDCPVTAQATSGIAGNVTETDHHGRHGGTATATGSAPSSTGEDESGAPDLGGPTWAAVIIISVAAAALFN
ncbi:uncharacterized protein DNG_07435 [Cephalotrichum gorgonifer]|uniref:Cell wall mannoprotein PIR1-like C-terminal domain-containing protein n=1 Tax=Cephalotrichum gorgonifer TaxID=2041049 RepID=A0AAE8N4L0_9PEZI|nr:uncharacterized protein DNG_07435 [Cephalotrichum gorgonifer]